MNFISIILSYIKTDFKSKIVFVASIMILFLGCKDKETSNKTIYQDQNYTDLYLDKTSVKNYFEAFPESDTIKNEVIRFYERRDYQFAWFNKKGMTASVPIFLNQIQNYSIDFNDKSFNNIAIDSLITIISSNEKSSVVKEKKVKELELSLTTNFFKYSKKVYGGITKNPNKLDWFIPRKKKNYQALLDSLVISNKGDKIIEPVNNYYIKLKVKLREYRIIAKNGGFPMIKIPQKTLSITDNDSTLIKVKHYLFLTADWKEKDQTILFTTQLAKAIISFQHRMGLVESGKLTTQTITELNKPIDFRIKQIMLNLERLRWVPVEMENKFLLINIPEYKLHIIENGSPVWTTNVVVGKDVKQTTIFRGNISSIILNPYWNIPTSIIGEEILPSLKKNPNYLTENNMEVVSGKTIINPSTISWNKYDKKVPFEIRQKPGNDNALGKMKFLFPNNFNIYLHDTPSKGLFRESKRAFSHGCIRVENPKKLVLYFIQKDSSWSTEKIDSIFKTNKEFGIPIKPSVPIYIVYFTTWVDNEGQLNFRNDIYNLDEQLSNEIFGE